MTIPQIILAVAWSITFAVVCGTIGGDIAARLLNL